MIALGIECSNTRGMGHLFRALQYVKHLDSKGCPYILLINDDNAAIDILKKGGISFEIVNYEDLYSNWEKGIIEKYHVDCWFNDKFETADQMGRHIKEENISFFVIDDVGEGERYANISFSGMLYPTKNNYLCPNVCKGVEYIILNQEIEIYRKERSVIKKIIVMLGGSDTYGATIGVVEALKKWGIVADIVIGPDFAFIDELNRVNKGKFHIFQNVPSLIQLFHNYDFAITGGGCTCCEAMASGLPCAVIANEDHEVNTAKYFEKMGCCIYLGKHDDWKKNMIRDIDKLDINRMSKNGMNLFSLDAVKKIFDKIFNQT